MAVSQRTKGLALPILFSRPNAEAIEGGWHQGCRPPVKEWMRKPRERMSAEPFHTHTGSGEEGETGAACQKVKA